MQNIKRVWGPNPNCERGYAAAISSNPDGTKLAYGSEKNLVLRDNNDSSKVVVFSKHRGNVRVAKFNSDGTKLASGDEVGQKRMFNVNGDNLEEDESKLGIGIGGRVFDICWYPNDKGLAYVGDAKGQNGRAFTLSGNDQGKFPSSKRLTSIDMFFFDDDHKKINEAKVVTGGDDMKVRVYTYNKREFTCDDTLAVGAKLMNSCNIVRFSPDGKFVAAAGFKDIRILDSENGFSTAVYVKGGNKKAGEHSGSILGLAWNPAGTMIFTASSDKSVKLWGWNPASKELKMLSSVDMKSKSRFGGAHNDMQVGCCFAGDASVDRYVSVSLSGDLNYFTVGSGGTPTLNWEKSVSGPTGRVTSIDVNSTGLIATTSKGEVLFYDTAGIVTRVKDLKDPKYGVGVSLLGDKVYSTGWDDRVREIDAAKSMTPTGKVFNLTNQPVHMARAAGSDDLFVVTTKRTVSIFNKADPKTPLAILNIDASTAAAQSALTGDGSVLAVATENKVVTLYSVSGGSINETKKMGPYSSGANCLTFSPDGNLLALGMNSKFVMMFTAAGDPLTSDRWSQHTSKVNDIQFSPNSELLLSSGGEGNLYIWNAKEPTKRRPLKEYARAHLSGVVQGKWMDNSTFFSVGLADGSIKQWDVAL